MIILNSKYFNLPEYIPEYETEDLGVNYKSNPEKYSRLRKNVDFSHFLRLAAPLIRRGMTPYDSKRSYFYKDDDKKVKLNKEYAKNIGKRTLLSTLRYLPFDVLHEVASVGLGKDSKEAAKDCLLRTGLGVGAELTGQSLGAIGDYVNASLRNSGKRTKSKSKNEDEDEKDFSDVHEFKDGEFREKEKVGKKAADFMKKVGESFKNQTGKGGRHIAEDIFMLTHPLIFRNKLKNNLIKRDKRSGKLKLDKKNLVSKIQSAIGLSILSGGLNSVSIVNNKPFDPAKFTSNSLTTLAEKGIGEGIGVINDLIKAKREEKREREGE